MARRRPGTGSHPPTWRSTLANPYDTSPTDDTGNTGTARALQILTGAALATSAAIAMTGTAAADGDDTGSMPSGFDGGAPDSSGADTFPTESFNTPTPTPDVRA